MLRNLLDIEAPMISAVSGPTLRHAQQPLICDIVLAAEHATLQDSAHFRIGMVPGDGVHFIFPPAHGTDPRQVLPPNWAGARGAPGP